MHLTEAEAHRHLQEGAEEWYRANQALVSISHQRTQLEVRASKERDAQNRAAVKAGQGLWQGSLGEIVVIISPVGGVRVGLRVQPGPPTVMSMEADISVVEIMENQVTPA